MAVMARHAAHRRSMGAIDMAKKENKKNNNKSTTRIQDNDKSRHHSLCGPVNRTRRRPDKASSTTTTTYTAITSTITPIVRYHHLRRHWALVLLLLLLIHGGTQCHAQTPSPAPFTNMPTNPPTVSQNPTVLPTTSRPTATPTNSWAPSGSARPTQSAHPSRVPSVHPTAAPSVSARPSVLPSVGVHFSFCVCATRLCVGKRVCEACLHCCVFSFTHRCSFVFMAHPSHSPLPRPFRPSRPCPPWCLPYPNNPVSHRPFYLVFHPLLSCAPSRVVGS